MIIDYVENYEIVSTNQSGIRAGYNCITTLFDAADNILTETGAEK